MPKLTIINDDGAELLALTITKTIDGPQALVAILGALDALPEPRRKRRDAGTVRRGKEVAP